MAYTYPSGNISSSIDFFGWINTVTQNFFIPGILVAAFFVILIKLYFNSNELPRSVAAASFVIMILSIMFRTLDLVSTGFMVIFIIMTGFCVIWLRMENSGGVA